MNAKDVAFMARHVSESYLWRMRPRFAHLLLP